MGGTMKGEVFLGDGKVELREFLINDPKGTLPFLDYRQSCRV